MQFFYTRESEKEVKGVDGQADTKEKVLTTDSFNTELVIFSVGQEDGTRVVILNDGHEESRYDWHPVIGSKKKEMEFRKERAWYQSQMILNKEDNDRFVKWLNYNAFA